MSSPPEQTRDIGFQPGRSARNNLITYLEEHRRRFPDRTALQWVSDEAMDDWDRTYEDDLEHDSITFEQLHDRICRTARGLSELGIEKGDRVVIFVPMSVQLYQSMLAVLQNGAIAVFLEGWARRQHLAESVGELNPKAMISVERAFQFAGQIPQVDEIPHKINAFEKTDKSLAQLATAEPRRDAEPVEGDETALITFTTGSSGRPKGANRTHRFLSGQHRALHRCIPYKEEDVDLPAFPVFSLNNLASGVNTVIPAVDVGSPTEEDPKILATQLRTCGATCSTLSPSMLRGVAGFCDEQDIELDGLRRVVTGGAPITNDDLRGFKAIAPSADIQVLYGSTEAEPIAHVEADELLDPEHPPTDDDFGVNVGDFSQELKAKFIRISKDPIDLSDGSWADWEVEDGEVGEVVVAGPHVCESYYNNPEATRETKIRDADGEVWHRTSDLGYLDEHDRVWLVGRIHNAIRRGDEWLFPVQAEIALKAVEGTDLVAFLGLPDDELGERTCAAVSLEEGADADEVADRARQALEDEGIEVDEVVVREDIPMDPRHHSKVQYDELREQILKESRD